ncbi:carbohydrate ABC transporter permease [Amantichitinum ursilacus]|uniref:Trehalose transport system permease protein SugB n=1 Tax=Amantichitinum ursilacus TaxID=857265 RepID=A0A0N0XHP9_9NEIS|nr:carbohydrate ABC transporter permease [Amantichitinum ursilacus]KPC49283.1 Trehalose transport system permease protein SugB [Amantichitinum ursilacus]
MHDHDTGIPKNPWSVFGYYVAVVAVLIFALFPFFYAISSSLKKGQALFTTSLWPAHPSLDNYIAVFKEQPFGANLLNSVIVATAVVAFSLGLSLLSAYALGRVSFRGRGTLMLCILSVSMFPQVALLSGLFELIRFLGLYDHLGALMLSDLIFTLPFTVWVLVTFIRDLPKELEEAAVMDGVGLFTLIFKIFMPLLWPAMVATSLLAFIAAWNEFLFALTFTLSSDERTVPVAIALISGASSFELPWGNLMAASVIVTVPLILLVLAFQRYIVSGLTAGAVKG